MTAGRQGSATRGWRALLRMCVVALLLSISLAGAKAEERVPAGAEESAGMVPSRLIDGALPTDDPASPLWEEATVVEFPMSPQVHWEPRIFSVTVTSLKVRSLHNGQQVVFLLEYKDPTENPGDAAAIEFPVGDKKSHFAHAQEMAQVEGGRVNIWYWRASRGVSEMNAKGFGTTAAQTQQNVTGKGVWKDGVWRVAFARDLENNDPDDVQFAPGKFVQIAFAVWDEANQETGSKKAVTSWWWFFAQPPPDRSIWLYTGLVVLGVIAVEVAVIRRVRRKG